MSDILPLNSLEKSYPAIARSDNFILGPNNGQSYLRLCGQNDLQGDALRIKDSVSRKTIRVQAKYQPDGGKDKTGSISLLIRPQGNVKVVPIDKNLPELRKKQKEDSHIISHCNYGEGVWIGNTKVVVEDFSESMVQLKVEIYDQQSHATVTRNEKRELPLEVDKSLTQPRISNRDDSCVLKLFEKPGANDWQNSLTPGELKSIEEATEDGGYLNYAA